MADQSLIRVPRKPLCDVDYHEGYDDGYHSGYNKGMKDQLEQVIDFLEKHDDRERRLTLGAVAWLLKDVMRPQEGN